ncbi:hypothetical protein FQA39_LY16697 [Lamprigera yunnana]|nr:hypothetical protein FQA39_LY16697 [Lamprigera yunnana]
MLNVPAGKSISVADVEEAMKSKKPTAIQKASTFSGTSTTNKRPRRKPSIEDDIAEASNDSEYSDDEHDDNKKWSKEDLSGSDIAEKLFPGGVMEIKPEGYIVSTMDRSKMNWKWPIREDAIFYSKEEQVIAAGVTEYRLPEEVEAVDEDGVPFITVSVVGAWLKRSQ